MNKIFKFKKFFQMNESSHERFLIPEALEEISKKENAIKVTSKEEFDRIAKKQKYFNAIQTHSFYTNTEYTEWSKDGSTYTDKDSENSIILYNNDDIVQVWDDKNSIGYIIPS